MVFSSDAAARGAALAAAIALTPALACAHPGHLGGDDPVERLEGLAVDFAAHAAVYLAAAVVIALVTHLLARRRDRT